MDERPLLRKRPRNTFPEQPHALTLGSRVSTQVRSNISPALVNRWLGVVCGMLGDVDPKKAAFAKIGAALHMPHMSTKRQRMIFLTSAQPRQRGAFPQTRDGQPFFYRAGRGDLRGEAGRGWAIRNASFFLRGSARPSALSLLPRGE